EEQTEFAVMTKGKTGKKNENKSNKNGFAPLSSCSPSPSSSSNEAAELVTSQFDIAGPSDNIAEDIKTILTSLRRITSTIAEIKQGNADILGRFASIESRLSDSDGRLMAAEMKIKSLALDVADFRNRLNDQENRARRNNVRILGFPEGVEQGSPTRFLGETLPALLKLPEGTDLSFEQAHRSLAPKPVPGQRPRPFIVKLLHFPVKELLLKAARELGKVEWEGHSILFFPDLSKALQDCRRLFLPVKKILHEENVKYGLFYPATLKVMYKGKTTAFGTAEEAEKFVEK
uniref:L1 transposable element RRM domain-containing protein n=1 Tax=Latimeria chalumnae TaxID=7897 RepID=H2ZT97_LATCH